MRVLSEKDLLSDKERIQEAVKRVTEELQGLQMELKDNEAALRVLQKVGKSGKGVAAKQSHRPPPPAAAQKAAPTQSRRGRTRSNLSEILRQSILSQTDEFTPMKVMDYIRKHHTDIAPQITSNHMSNMLWRLKAAKEIEVVRQGGSGKPSTYVVVHRN